MDLSLSEIIEISLVVILSATLGGIVWYLYKLRQDFYEACREAGNLRLFANSPFGIPSGSVRSTLALLIVLFAIGYIGITGMQEPPQFLTAIVSTVLGFYFGSRSSSDAQKKQEEIMMRMNRNSANGETTGPSASAPAPTAPSPGPSSAPATADPKRRKKAEGLLDQLREGLSITEVASGVLPQSIRQRFSSVTQSLQGGIDTVQNLLEAENIGEALNKGHTLLKRFRQDNPVRSITERALGTFGSVLSGAVAPLPLIGTLVTVASSVKEQVYGRWKARIMHLSFEPADLPIERVDANTGFTLLVDSPIMKEAFRNELEANDRRFMENTAEELLATEDLDTLWENYADRFDSRKQFEQGVDQLRRAAADLDLKEELDPALFREVGGYEETVAAVDELHGDEAARGDLDAIVTMFEALKKADGVKTSIRDLFANIKSDLESASSSS